MPELPEVETIRRELDREVGGRKIKAVEVTNSRSIRRHSNKKQFTSRLEGVKIKNVQRKGKYLIVNLDSGDILVIHLGMSGQLLRHATKDPLDKHNHVTISFTQGPQIRFVDPRTFGEMFVTTPDELNATVEELAHLGMDPVDQPVSWVVFGRLLHSHQLKLKTFLMDQSIIAGLGNIYSDEILWHAGLRYDRLSNELSSQEIRRLYRSVVETLHEAIKHGGSTLSDQQYVNISGKPGGYQQFHEVYDRDKLACRRCRAVVTKAKFQSRTTYYCEECQI